MIRASAFAFVLLFAPCAFAQSGEDPLINDLRFNRTMAQFVGDVQREFSRMVRKQPSLTQALLDAREKTKRATQRASALAFALRYDLNGDLKVTKAEIAEANLGGLDEGNAADLFTPFDTNRNGVVDIPEISAGIAKREFRSDEDGEKYRVLLARDGGRDGALTLNEITAAAERTFRAADTNGDGVLDRAEYDVVRPRLTRPRPAIPGLPAPR